LQIKIHLSFIKIRVDLKINFEVDLKLIFRQLRVGVNLISDLR